MKIYLASSWRNGWQPIVLMALREAGHEVYDFRNRHNATEDHGVGFHWEEIDPDWKSWTAEGFREGLKSPRAQQGFAADKDGMDWADACVLLLPCGRSAHLEAGYMAGEGKPVHVLLSNDEVVPELMYGLLTTLSVTMGELVGELR